MRRLATLVPPPRAHLVRYHGVFGPASAWRREIIPAPPAPAFTPEPECGAESAPAKEAPPPTQIPWAELLQRIFREDILLCPCGGRRKVVAFITEKKVIQGILDRLGLPTTGPPLAPAQSSSAGAHDLWIDDVPELQQSLR